MAIGCETSWDGVDFTPCFRERFLLNFPLALISLSALILLISYTISYFHGTSLDASFRGHSDLTKLESDVIASAVASNLLPDDKVPPGEVEKVIEDFKEEGTDMRRWERVGRVVRVVGAVIFLCAQIAASNKWKEIAFPTYLVVLSLLPSSPITALLTIHIVPALLLLRSTVLRPHSVLAVLPTIVEAVYWAALISIPYGDPLDHLLAGAKSKGGGSSGTYGEELPNHIEEPTSAFSRATYTFLLPLLFKHYRKPITIKDIPAMREDDSAAASLGAFRAHQAKRRQGDTPGNLAIDLLLFFLPDIFIQCVWAGIFICLQYLPPTGLRLLLRYINDRDSKPLHVAFLYVGMMAGGQCISVTAMGQALFIGRRLCIRLRAIIIAEVFTKALRRRDLAGRVTDGSASEGKIANLVSVDAFQVSEICAYIFYLFSSPLAVVINSALLYDTLGVASFAGIAVLVLLIPVQALLGRLITVIQRRFMAATDARLEAVTEVIAHVKLIKFNAWESKFFDRMTITRRHELHVLAQRFATTVLFDIVIWGTPVLVTAFAFAIHSLVLHQPLTADRAFSSLILFNMLRDPLGIFQDTLTRLLQSYTSCVRIQGFLEEPDTLKYEQISRPGPADPQIGFRGAVIGYTDDGFRLGTLDLAFPIGGLSVVTGPVGCGKSTLILSLLGETTLLQGKVFMPDDHANREVCPIDSSGLSDTVAYCAQTSWLVGASIRDNIVFGSRWDRDRYDTVVNACALRRDFEIFELGDETEVGEKGTTCSGGQKARIALARALYSPAKTIILDDVLSAVDAQTARHLHIHCLLGPLMRDRTVILVSHAINLVVPSAAFVVMLDDGIVTASGTPSELMASGALDLSEDDDTVTPTPSSPRDVIEITLDGIEGDALEAQKQVQSDKASPEATKLAKQLVVTEKQGQGSIGGVTYLLYFRSMGGISFWIFLATSFFGAQAMQIALNTWIKDWANSDDQRSQILAQGRSTQFYLGVYCALAGVYIVGIAAKFGVGFFGSLTASGRLYDHLLKRILGAKMRFFDSTPSGRIMNRLSKDMSSIDTEATEILLYFANCVLSVIAVLVVVVFSTPWFLTTFFGVAVLYWLVGSLYVTTSREIKRFDSVTRSPIFISFSEALVGMSTIRSYGDSARFTRKIFQELDQNTRCFWYLWQANRVLSNFSNFVGSLVTIFACIFALRSPNMDAGAVGLSITYALSFTEYVLWVVRLYASSEMAMNSVERVGEYLDLEVEEEEHSKGIEPPAYWPSREGSVIVEKLTCRYAPQLDPVLRDVSFTIGPREKIGICGRTGSGKSTLALSFFRFLHHEGGSVFIDGIDIAKLSLTALRSRLTILPQEAQLFSGSVRDNLDPFGQHEDYEVWEALRQCGLSGKTPSMTRATSRATSRAQSSVDLRSQSAKEHSLRVQSLKNLQAEAFKPTIRPGDDEEEVEDIGERVIIRSLDEKVAVGGKNFSQGQRQLLALARGLLKLRTSSFLIMDESTANLDHATDMTIQNVLRTGLADTQMLVIAHRLMTVCGLDKILVLDHGKVIEFGPPWELMQKEDGPFRDLCRQSGEEAQLIEMAKAVHEAKAAANI